VFSRRILSKNAQKNDFYFNDKVAVNIPLKEFLYVYDAFETRNFCCYGGAADRQCCRPTGSGRLWLVLDDG
jgi:hypothetical protein